jgi:NAD(P)-dependent dehydrogenase (short-subunit alcohol dehydrogenase family)
MRKSPWEKYPVLSYLQQHSYSANSATTVEVAREKDMKHGRLAGKVAIVTGAAPQTPGIGNGTAVAMLFAREGAKVLLVNRSESRAQELQRTIAQEGGECSVCAADVTQAAEVERMVETVIQRYGKLDILHNNVGGGTVGRITEVTEADWDTSMSINLKSTMLCCKYSIPRMIASGGGSIINVSSVAGVIGVHDRQTALIAYSTAKAGVSGLTRALAADHAADGIRVNCIVIGMVDTPLVAGLGQEVLEKRRLATPLQTTGTGWDVGWAAVYLASDEARWVTGIDLPIDGGLARIIERPR